MSPIRSFSRSLSTSVLSFIKIQTSSFPFSPARQTMAVIVGVACLALALNFAPAAFAQGSDTGSVRGAVMDQEGNAVANAEVTITNVETGYLRSEKTDTGGNYGFQSLPVGRYNLKVTTAQGFKAFQVKDIILHVNDNLTYNAKLAVGTTDATVEVTANQNQVELTTAEVSSTIAGAQITELPLNGRNFAQLLTLSPGVESDGGFTYDKKGQAGGADLSIGGAASNSNEWLVDGASILDVGSGRTINIYPSLDSIQEFKVERNSYNAQFGGAGGGIVTIVTKSGTNDFHGSAFYEGRNDLLDAKDPVLKSIDPKAKKNTVRRNDYGFAFGGPIKKDKIFFFVSEEWNRLIEGVVRNAHVPTPAQRTGDFSDAVLDPAFQQPGKTSGCLPLGGLHDPDPTNPGGAFTQSPSTPGVFDIIPAGRQSPAGSTILNTYFLPTLAPGSPNYACGTNWVKSIGQPTFFREDSVRGDINITKSTTLMLRYIGDNWDFGPSAVGQTGWGADSGASNIQESWSAPGRVAVAKLSHIFGATAVNDFQFSYSANRINISQATPAAAQALNKIIPTFLAGGNPTNNPPVWINGGGLPTIWSFAPWHNSEDLFAFQDDYSKVIGHHTLKMGGIYSHNAKDQDNFSQIQGVTFGPGGYNGCKNVGDPGCAGLANTNTGYGPSDYLLKNMAVNWGEQNPIFKKQGRWVNLEFYLNDDWKISNRLTLNLGIRYSYLPWPYQATDQLTVFNPIAFNPALGKAACNGLLYSSGLGTNPCPAGTGGVRGPNRAIQNNFNAGFQPRLGVAWDPTGSGKWSIRAGFGQFYNRDDIYVTDGTAGVNPPFVASFNSTNGRFLDNTNQLPACTPNCFSTGLGNAGIGQSTTSTSPYTLQFNTTIQRELWNGARLEVGYVGSRTKNWTFKTDANAIAPGNRLAFAQSNGNAAGNAMKPFNVITTGGIPFYTHQGRAAYDSLQTAFSTRFQRNSVFQMSYTFSKTLSNTLLHVNNGGGNLVLDPFNANIDYGLATINRPHIFAASVVYNTPRLEGTAKPLRYVFGSWEAGSIMNIATGSSYTPFIGGISNLNDPSGIGGGAGVELPNIVPGQPCEDPNFKTTGFNWINPKRYTLNGFRLGSIGTAPIGDCQGPPTRTVDASLAKNVHLTERVEVQFRIDVFNLFNHPNFGNPGGTGIGFTAGCGANTPVSQAEFLDANGNPVLNALGQPSCSPIGATGSAVTLANTTPSKSAGGVGTINDRNREFQYSVKFKF
jgi:hypothetical protein